MGLGYNYWHFNYLVYFFTHQKLYLMNLADITILEKENFDSITDIFEESGEEECLFDSYLKFRFNDKEYEATFLLKISGEYTYYKGDYWTPGYSELESIDYDITLDSLFIDEIIVQLSPKTKTMLEDLAKKIITL